MNVVGVIPARYGSTRFKAKILADLLGKPLIQHVWENAKKSKLLDYLLIACDDKRVKKCAEGFGADVVMTSKNHTSGSDRIAEAVKPLDVAIVVNIQGDEPLVHPTMIDDMVKALLEDKTCMMATVIKPLEDKREIKDPNIVKAVIDNKGFALYFSRAAIPYRRDQITTKNIRYYKHFGLYAYRKKFLLNFKNLPASHLEKAERLEQLRALEAGYKIKTVETPYDTIAVDTKEDLRRVEEFLKKKGCCG